MNPKKIWANIAVSDLDRTTRFYTALGFKPNGRSDDLTSFFFGEEQFIIHFFRKEVLINSRFIEAATDCRESNEMILTLYAESKEEVDLWAGEVEPAGGRLVSKPVTFGESYYGFVFADPDGHRFNVFHM